MRTLIASTVAVVATGLGLASAGASARFSEHEGLRQQAVRYNVADLKTREGADAMYSRLRRAAEIVCGGLEAEQFVKIGRDYRACRAETLANAVQEVNRPLLTQVYDSHVKNGSLAAAHRPAPTRAPHA